MTSHDDKADDLWQRMYGSRGLAEGKQGKVGYTRDQKPPPMPKAFTDRRSDPGYRHPTRDDIQAARLAALTSWAQGIVDGVRAAFEELGKAAAGWAETLSKLATQLVDAGLVPDEPAADPRERALLMRRHRNTGPDNRPSLDGRRRAKR